MSRGSGLTKVAGISAAPNKGFNATLADFIVSKHLFNALISTVAFI